jgi:hypothetical protein
MKLYAAVAVAVLRVTDACDVFGMSEYSAFAPTSCSALKNTSPSCCSPKSV